MNDFSIGEVSLADRLFSWWYHIAAPPEVLDSAPLRDRMRVRSGKLTSLIFLIEFIVTLINLSAVISTNRSVVPGLVSLLIILVVGVLLNRTGKTTIAGVLIIIDIELGLGVSILHTQGLFAVLLCSFFVTSELVAVSLLTPWVVLPLTLGNCLFIAALITFMPDKTPEMIHLLATQPVSMYVTPIALHITVAVVAFVWSSSAYREMKRAGNAEEVNKLTMEMALQRQVVQQEKQQLEESIQQIISVHMQVANGNLHARVPLDQHNVLWTIAGSLNNLVARLQRWRQDATQLRQNEQALQQLLYNIQMARREGKSLQAYTTGTSLDTLIQEVSKGIAAPQQHNQSISIKQPPDSWS